MDEHKVETDKEVDIVLFTKDGKITKNMKKAYQVRIREVDKDGNIQTTYGLTNLKRTK